MANRQNGGDRNDRKNGKHHNQFGLKEAYFVLQKDFLELRKAFVENEQQLVNMQTQYDILREAYQKLEQESKDQLAKLLEKLEKSYDAYNEKFVRVEELEEEVNQFKKLGAVERDDEKKKEVASKRVDAKDRNFEGLIVDNAVERSLAAAGLTIVKRNKNFEVCILDTQKLRQFAGFNISSDGISCDKESIDRQHSNALLQPAMLSLKEYSQKHKNELSRANATLVSKTEERLNWKKGVREHCGSGKLFIDGRTVQRIIHAFSEMSEFVVELKKTIVDQNSWLDVLTSTLNESKKLQQLKNTCARRTDAFDSSRSNPRNQNLRTKSSVLKGELHEARNGLHLSAGRTPPFDVLSPSVKSRNDAELENFEDYTVVSSKRTPFQHLSNGKHVKHEFASQPLSRRENKDGRPKSDRSLRNELEQLSISSVTDGRRTYEGFSQHRMNGKFEHCVAGTTADVCPMCNFIFDANADLSKRRTHINSHFED